MTMVDLDLPRWDGMGPRYPLENRSLWVVCYVAIFARRSAFMAFCDGLEPRHTHVYGPTSTGTIGRCGNPPADHYDPVRLPSRRTPHATRHTLPSPPTEYQEAFALFDKRGTGRVPKESLGELLRSLGQNPTQREVAELGQRVQGGSCEWALEARVRGEMIRAR
jgi:hypothetical protein